MKIHTTEIVMITAKVLLLLTLIGNVVYKLNTFYGTLPVPVAMVEKISEDERITKMKGTLERLGCPKKQIPKIAPAIIECSEKIKVDPILIAVLMKTESTFDKDAVSSKGYKGLMQTPTYSGFEDVDTLHGCRKLEEKMRYAHGDLPKALALYKGGDNPEAKRYAKYVLTLYKQIRNEG